MKRFHLAKGSTCAALLLASILPLPGQEKPVPQEVKAPAAVPVAQSRPGERAAADDDTVTLDPFVVSADEDEGYSARYTLAGTRIRTDVRDVGSSITTITTKFLKDTNSTNIIDVLVYTPNAEVSGPGGNFLGNGDNETAGSLLYGRTRIRGLVPADNTRDLFLTNIPFDSYNSAGIDIQRGANSILFGIGSPGGIVNTRINHANFRTSRSLEAQVETFGSTRFTGDFNQVLIDKELSFRLSFLNKERKFQQEPAFEDDKRIYAAVRWDPSFLNKHRMHTTFEVSYEDGKIDSNQPRNNPPADFISPFYTPAFDNIRGTGLNYRTAVSYSTTNPWVNTAEPVGSQTNISAFTKGQAETTAYRGNYSGQQAWVGEGFWQGINGYPRYATNRKLPGWTISAFKDRVITDDSTFDFYNQLLDGDTKAEFNYFKVFNAALRQTFLDDTLGYEIVYDNQETHSGGRRFLSGRGYGLFLDIMGAIGGGTIAGAPNPLGGTFAGTPDPVNPHYGQIMVIGGFNQGAGSDWTDETKQTGRITAFYDLNFKKLMGEDSFAGRVFGRNTFSVLGSQYQQDVTNATSRDFYTNDGYVRNTVDNSGRPVAAFNYLSSTKYTAVNSVHGANLPRMGGLPMPAANQPIQLFNTNTAAPRTWQTYTYDTIINSLLPEEQRVYSGGGKRRANIDSWAAVWQGYWFDGTVVPLIGYREDKAFNTNANSIPSSTIRNLAVANPYSDAWVLGNPGLKQKVESLTYSVVTHLPGKWRDKLPGRMDVQLIANQSENFDPRPGRVDVLNRPLPAPDGNTKEFGVAVSMLDDKLYLKIVHYKTRINNADLSNLANINALRATEVWATQSAAGHLELNGSTGGDGTYFQASTVYGISTSGGRVTYRPPGPFVGSPYTGLAAGEPPVGTLRPAYTQAELDAAYVTQRAASLDYRAHLPSDAFLDAFGINKDQFKAGATTITTGTLASPVVTGTTISEGTELELVANPIKGLNISFNVSKTKAFRQDLAQSYIDYIDERYKVFQGPAGDVRLWTAGDNDTTIDPYHTNGGGGLARTNFANSVLAPIRKFAALEGTNVPEMRPWSANLTANYAFQGNGILRGVNIGGAYRWQDKDVVGYPVIVNGVGLEVQDVAHPYHGDSEGALDLWVGYYRRNVLRNVDLRLRFGVRNVLYEKDLILASVNPDGSPAVYRIPSPRIFNFSTSLEF